jgi:hypothetical protein
MWALWRSSRCGSSPPQALECHRIALGRIEAESLHEPERDIARQRHKHLLLVVAPQQQQYPEYDGEGENERPQDGEYQRNWECHPLPRSQRQQGTHGAQHDDDDVEEA